MSYYFPQAAMVLRIRWEDFGASQVVALQQIYTLPIIARRVTVNINDYTTADTFECEIDYKTFPFDPRCIRACGVSIFLEDRGKIFNQDNSLNVLEPSPDNVIFQGFVDDETISFDDEKRVVKFEGRDFTGILIDAKYLAGKPLDLGQPLDVLVDQLLHGKDDKGALILPAAADLKVDNRTGKTLPTIKQFYPGFGAPLAGQRNAQRDDTYWEIIQDLVSRAGLICFIEIDKLVITSPRVLYDRGATAKQFVYGQNIKNLEYKRKLGRHKGFNVVVRCLDVTTKEVITAKLPEEGTAEWSKSTGIPNTRVKVPVITPVAGGGAVNQTPQDAPAMAFRVTNVKDKAALIEIGEKIFEELSRQQIEGSFETHEMETPDKESKTFDLTKLRIGTAIGIEIDQGDLKGMSRFTSLSEREKFLRIRGYEPSVANAFAQSMGKFMSVFYTKAVTFTLDSESGFKLKVDFINFVDLDNKGIDFG